MVPRLRFTRAGGGIVTPSGALSSVYIPPGGGIVAPRRAPPNLGSNSFLVGTESFWDDSSVTFPTNYQTAHPTAGRGGGRCMRVILTNGVFNGAFLAHNFGRRNRIRARWYELCLPGQQPAGNVKGPCRFHDTIGPGNNGEFYSNREWEYAWEGQAVTWHLGLTWGAFHAAFKAYIGASFHPTIQNLADGVSHCYEVDYDRNVAGGFADARIKVDEIPLILPPVNAYSDLFPGTLPEITYVGGDQRTLTPSAIRAVRSPQGGTFIDDLGPYETTSDPTKDAVIDLEDYAFSTEEIGSCPPGEPGTPSYMSEQWVNASGSPVAIGSYAGGRWLVVDGLASELVIPAGGGSLEGLAPFASTNAHVQYAGTDLPSQNYAIVSALRHRTGGLQLSELYGYMVPGQNTGYFNTLNDGIFSIQKLVNGVPQNGDLSGTFSIALGGSIPNGAWRPVRFELETLSDRVRLRAYLYHAPHIIGNQYPVVITCEDLTPQRITGGRPGAGGFYAGGGQSIGVGPVVVTHLLAA